jgi:hypothetical protein
MLSFLKESCILHTKITHLYHFFISEILATRLDESWTQHFQLKLAQVFKILDFYIIYNGGTHQNFQKCLLDASKLIATSKSDFLKESCVFGFTCKTFGHSFQT